MRSVKSFAVQSLMSNKKFLALAIVATGIPLHPVKAISTGDIAVNTGDKISLTYTYKFSHGVLAQNTWDYIFPALNTLSSDWKEINDSDGAYDSSSPKLNLENINDSLGHGSFADFNIDPFQSKKLIGGVMRGIFKADYITSIHENCADKKKSCSKIDSELILKIKIGTGAQTTFESARAEAYEPTEVPAPLPLFGVCAFFGYSRKLRKRITIR